VVIGAIQRELVELREAEHLGVLTKALLGFSVLP